MIDIEAQDEDALRKAERARQAQELVKPILSGLKAMIMEEWRATNASDTAMRERMFFAHDAVTRVERALFEAIEAGELVRHARRTVELLAKVANG